MEITKAKFVRTLCDNPHFFFGVYHARVNVFFDKYSKIDSKEIRDSLKYCPPRIVKSASNYQIVFTDDSRLTLQSAEEHYYFEFDITDIHYLVQEIEWYDDFDSKTYYKCVIYCKTV